MLTKLKIMIKTIEEKFGINKFNLNKNNKTVIYLLYIIFIIKFFLI